MLDVAELAADFGKAACLAGFSVSQDEIIVERLAAPHDPPTSLPAGMMAVYAFMFGDRCLKVGKAGPKSAARFCSQHYLANGAPSTLARSILKARSRNAWTELSDANIKLWICQNTDRINFLMPCKYGPFALALFESFIQCRLRPEFEGYTVMIANREKRRSPITGARSEHEPTKFT